MRIDVDLAAMARGESSALTIRQGDGAGRQAAGEGCTVVVFGRPRDAAAGTEIDAAGLVARYGRLGAGMAAGLHGAYAIAVVDVRAAKVMLFNDRMSVHGWCYAQRGTLLSIAPRADSIDDGADLDPQALFNYLFNHVIPSPDTIYRGVARLPPAHRLVVTPEGSTLEPHWVPAFTEPRSADFSALRDEFRQLVKSSVSRAAALQGGGIGTVGTFLSGGTDSSTVTGMLREVAGPQVRAYSIGFQADGYDEMAFASLAARHFGVDHRQHYVTPEEVCAGMPAVATHYDQPFGNSSAVPAYQCARIAREEGCTHLLAGDGGDELFGGNARYAKQRIFGLYDGVPEAMRRLVMNPLLGDNALAARLPLVSKSASYVQQARVPMPDRLHMYNLLLRIGLDEVLSPAFRRYIDADRALAGHRQVYGRSRGDHLVNRMLALDWKFTLADNDLPKVCGTTALAGVSVGFPLLSDELIDFSLKLPADYKLKGLKLRWFFKGALRGFLPDEILAKKKQGFGLPFGVWALQNPELARLSRDALSSFGTRGVVRAEFLAKLERELLPAHPGYYGELVWILTMLEFWLRAKRPDFRFTPGD